MTTSEAGAEWKVELARLFPQARWREPMNLHTTFRIGGPAECYVEIRRVSEIVPLFAVLRKHGIPLFIIGAGSNVLVKDGGIRGVVARLRGTFEKLLVVEECRLQAGAGASLARLASFCAARGLGGAEFLAGIPGTVGGALVTNAGTREGEIGDLVVEVKSFDVDAGIVATKKACDIRFEYRKSDLKGDVLVSALMKLKKKDKDSIIEQIRQLQKLRVQSQPIHTCNVGSVFKNPPGRFAAKIIEESGLKGFSVGGARVSPVHANFIENTHRAAASDVIRLIEIVRQKVRQISGADLELEIKIVGEA